MEGRKVKSLRAVFGCLVLVLASLSLADLPADAQGGGIIQRIAVIGNQRVEAATVASYLVVTPGQPFDADLIDQSLKILFATGLFADVVMERDGGTLLIRVVENPIINRIVFEGNSRLDREDLLEEAELRPRMIYTRSKVRADAQRIIELYRNSGRFAAVVEPKIIQRDQNRVDLVFEIAEGPKSRVSRINFVGNRIFSDGELRDAIATTEARWWKIFGSNDTYDPDRLAFDREQVRQYYLQRGYADFRMVSAVAELTPDQRDFFITFTLEEGEIYRFGKIEVESEVRELDAGLFSLFVRAQEGAIYNAKHIEDSIDSMTSAAGQFGFAFLDISPRTTRDREARTISILFRILETPRAYVERVDIHGNVRTLDRVVRREMRLAEGDAFNLSRVERSEIRLRSLGFFREATVEPQQGSQPDRVILDVTVEEQATGELTLGAGFSSFESFILNFSIRERNLLGRGQDLSFAINFSSLRRSFNLSFTEPYFLGKSLAAGISLFRSDFDLGRASAFSTTTTGASINFGFPLTEFVRFGGRYRIQQDVIDVRSVVSSPFLLGSVGSNTTSSMGYSWSYDSVNNFLRPSDGQRFIFNQDFAGLGGNIKYLRTSFSYDYFERLFFGVILHVSADAGFIEGIGRDVRINDRFFLGGPEIRGFDTAGVGPRDAAGNFLGGNLKYVASTELRLPLGAAASELGVQVAAFVDVGALARPDLFMFDSAGNPVDNSSVFSNGSPRVSVGIGITWDSPFGPFRIDMAKVIKKQPFDDTQFLQFNVGTTF